MFPTRPSLSTVPERIRLGVCLAHAVPHTVAVLTARSGARHVVAHHRYDAALTPCQLRSALLQPFEQGVPHIVDTIDSLEIVAGLTELGAGVHQTCHPAGPDQRWFASTLPSDTIEAIAGRCPADIDHRDISVRVLADVDLAVCAVCVSGTGVGLRLDAAACWLNTQCLVEELLLAAA